ncbi:MAG: ribosome maturation factor RimP [Actinomycetales bacterium]|nr:ribosome maturation factor RimP [Tetrasphaera sp.]NLW98417.1 ribosome maturation factor RimP [Actinomycetales bacterium]
MSAEDRIARLIEPVLAPLVIDEVKVTPAGRRRVVRIALDRATDETAVVDSPSPAMSLDEIAEATRAVSAVLDDSNLLGEQPYTLEVTSAGVGRPLTRPRHYQRGVGRLVVISRDGLPDLTARIVSAGPQSLTVRVAATKKEPERTETIEYAQIARARIEVEFSRPD